MDDESKTIVAVGIVLLGAIGIAYLFEILTTNLVILAVLTEAIGILSILAARRGYLSKVINDVRDGEGGGAFRGRGFDQLWDDLQEWEQREDRATELIWNPLVSNFTTTALPSSDKKWFRFVSIITPIEQAKRRLVHIALEANTGHIIHHSRVRFKEELKFPFQYVPLVRDMRRMNLTGREILKRLRQTSYGRLQSNYAPFDESFQSPMAQEEESSG